MMKLYDSAFSPFARKVRLVLDHKGLDYEVVDGLAKRNRDELAGVNGRVEVPALIHEGATVTNSSDIVQYLERTFPEQPVYPASPAAWARARSWERCADTMVDPILVDISYWNWAEREDSMPEGLLEAAQKDLDCVYAVLERDLDGRDFLCGELSIADIAFFPHIVSVRSLGVSFDVDRHPRVLAWMKRLRSMPIFAADLKRAKAFLPGANLQEIERRKIFWRGDRIEWILARGYHEWFLEEIRADRVLWPGLDIPR